MIPLSKKKSFTVIIRPFLLIAFGMALFSCLGNWHYVRNAPPVKSTVDLIEHDPRVAAMLGNPVAVSLVVSRKFERDFLRALFTGKDIVWIETTVRGSQGAADLSLSARNVDKQGWAGTFTLRGQSHQVLRNGVYLDEGTQTMLEGTFAPDGAPLVKK